MLILHFLKIEIFSNRSFAPKELQRLIEDKYFIFQYLPHSYIFLMEKLFGGLRRLPTERFPGELNFGAINK